MSETLFDTEPTIRREAVISDDGLYRYSLTRFWCDPRAFLQRPATFVMLNPSTADALNDDPTIQRCMKFARSWGLDGIRVVNLYAFRTSQPSVLWEALAGGVNIVGPENERTLGRALFSARNLRTPVVAAWGNHGALGRVEWLVNEAERWGVHLQCLGTTQSGAPKHPLARGHHRIPDDTEPQPWTTPHPRPSKDRHEGGWGVMGDDEIDGVRVGSLWKRNAGREVVRVERAWLYGYPDAEPTVRAHPTRGGMPIVAPTAWLREHYTEVAALAPSTPRRAEPGVQGGDGEGRPAQGCMACATYRAEGRACPRHRREPTTTPSSGTSPRESE